MDTLLGNVSLGANFSLAEYLLIVAEHEHRLYWFEPRLEIPLVFVYVVVIFIGLASNAVVAWLVARRRALRTATNLYIVNLAVSDMMLCLFCLPFTLVRLLVRNWTLGEGMCRCLPWLQAANVFASTTTVTAIALHRYGVVVASDSVDGGGGRGTDDAAERRTAARLIAVTWVVSALFGLPLFVYSHVERAEYLHRITYTMCLETWPSSRARVVYAVGVLVLQFAAPVLVLVGIHVRICCFLTRHVSGSALLARDARRAAKIARRYRKNIALLLTISVMFAICWLPLVLLNLLADVASGIFADTDFTLAFAVAHVIAMTSACLNPVLYGWFNSSFKRELKGLLLYCIRDTSQISDVQTKAPPSQTPLQPVEQSMQKESSTPLNTKRTCYSTFNIRNDVVTPGVSTWAKSDSMGPT